MTYVRLLMSRESSYQTLTALGDWSLFHTVDLNAHSAQAIADDRSLVLKKRIAHAGKTVLNHKLRFS